MIKLKDLLGNLSTESVKGSTDIAVRNIDFDYRKIQQDDVFVATRGKATNGHDSIEKAIAQGATTIVCETYPDVTAAGVTYIQVKQTNKALGILATNFYDNPSRSLKLTAVTGTNGKTTVASLLYQLFKKAGHKTGLISSVKIMVDDVEYAANHTTPDALTINKNLRRMVDAGVELCFMEASSHGIHHRRIEGLQFAGGIFTNLTHDHLHYHGSFAAYRDVKKSFFDNLPPEAFALTNLDDKNGLVMLQDTEARKLTYALESEGANYSGHVLENKLAGLLLKINGAEARVRLVGTFNAYNILAIYGAAVNLGLKESEILRILPDLDCVPGRFQFIVSDKKITAVVDAADTPDALKNVLSTINKIRTKDEQLITIFGCTGTSDKTKRPVMADIASILSDKVILTAHNPRNQAVEEIISDMEKGVKEENRNKIIAIVDRKEAIRKACQLARPKDFIMIAGKGDENHQEIKGVRYEFNDLAIVSELLA
ncbi:hypothetical protein TWF694_001821 [Orbilia ellipsospora]|uniref:UDP-N-acetylmuramyl-tripeptide synthetase n=1 Tax=Orbilia ellipsospora TaxID=2528407 RepID=A0AAV9X9U0_9PEZI